MSCIGRLRDPSASAASLAHLPPSLRIRASLSQKPRSAPPLPSSLSHTRRRPTRRLCRRIPCLAAAPLDLPSSTIPPDRDVTRPRPRRASPLSSRPGSPSSRRCRTPTPQLPWPIHSDGMTQTAARRSSPRRGDTFCGGGDHPRARRPRCH
jgi:hypothetical protein